jgi:RND family efflux transporter MFP subunit
MVVGEPQQAVTYSFSGMARSASDTVLSFRVSGSLLSLPVQVGQRVRAGERIASLDPTDYQLKVMELEAQLAQFQAGFTRARADYERVRGLYEVGNVSKSDLDQAQAAFESSRAGLEAVGKNLELVKQQLDYTRLHAPISGTVSSMPVENYQTVQAGQSIVVLSTDENLEFEVGLPDHLIHAITPGDQALVTFDVLPDNVLPARVSEVSIMPGALSTYPVKLRLEDSSAQIRPGMIGEARFQIRPTNGENFVTVPVEAVFGLPEGAQAVWIVDPQTETVHRRTVTVGRLLAEGLQILEGLALGEQLVVRGVHRLEEGQQVRLMNTAANTSE